MTDMERQRREFKHDNPALYAYVTAHEVTKALDRAGDAASAAADSYGAASAVWDMSAAHRGLAARLRNEARAPANQQNGDQA
jgi:hypothetical protein